MNGLCFLIAASCLLAALPVEETPAEETRDRYEFHQIEMGVPFGITLYAADEALANKAARAAYRRIDELERSMSDYDPDSELMQLVRTSAPGKPVQVSADLFEVLRRSQDISRQTGGAFDVSIGPVIKLWRKARRSKELPDPEAVKAALTHVGWEAIRLDAEVRTVELLKPDMQIDLGAIAPGYAADEALKVLRAHGIPQAIVDASGDLSIGDPPPDRTAWRIGVAPLNDPDATPGRYLLLSNCGAATSGDAYRFVEINGERYSHIVDPKTGLGLTHRSSVTVIAPDGATADGLASGVSVLGPELALKAIEKIKGVAALVVTVRDGERREAETEGFAKFDLATPANASGAE